MASVIHAHQKTTASVPNRVGELERVIKCQCEIIKKLESRMKKLEKITAEFDKKKIGR